jgi:hypothetical protein
MNKSFDGKIIVQLIRRDSCRICISVQNQLQKYLKEIDTVNLQIINLDRGDLLPPKRQCYITPAIWVEDHLWYLGGFNLKRFEEKISELAAVGNPKIYNYEEDNKKRIQGEDK